MTISETQIICSHSGPLYANIQEKGASSEGLDLLYLFCDKCGASFKAEQFDPDNEEKTKDVKVKVNITGPGNIQVERSDYLSGELVGPEMGIFRDY